MTKHERLQQFKSPAAIDAAIAKTARELVKLVRERIDARGRVDPNLIACIKIDYAFVAASYIDYPDDFGDLVNWRRR